MLILKFGVNKPVIIVDSCVVKLWFTFANLQCVSQTATVKQYYFVLYFVFEWPVPAYIFAHLSNIASLPAGSINTDTCWKLNMVFQTARIAWKQWLLPTEAVQFVYDVTMVGTWSD